MDSPAANTKFLMNFGTPEKFPPTRACDFVSLPFSEFCGCVHQVFSAYHGVPKTRPPIPGSSNNSGTPLQVHHTPSPPPNVVQHDDTEDINFFDLLKKFLDGHTEADEKGIEKRFLNNTEEILCLMQKLFMLS
ncbi:hypothetical protein TNCV_5083051 [Trichonephila clavipes]|nr:hypothetical protein TNCV_5083051 [Trichonephila clavipes]